MNTERLFPAFKDYLWGGNKLQEKYGKKTDITPCAESWELSFHEDGQTRLSDGRLLSDAVTPEALGSNVTDFESFPLLIKFIDAKDNLSVQVHPSDEYALKNEGSYGKTEMWYIVDAEEGAGIYLGFKRDVTRDECEASIQNNTLTDLLNFYEVKTGESYFIPSGTVHAIGKGCLIAEIQQNSNLTYRVYDYARKDKNGNQRELHIQKALEVLNFSKFENSAPCKDFLGVSKYFTARKAGAGRYSRSKKSFTSITVVKGKGSVDNFSASAGDSFFIPSGNGEFDITGDMEVIMTDVRKYYIGIDLGGTFIKGGIVDGEGNIIVKDKVPTRRTSGAAAVAANIAMLAKNLLSQSRLSASDIVGVGMGVPGMIDGENGEVIYSNNLGWEHFKIAEEVEKLLSLPVKISNDANAAALGETLFGCGAAYKNTVMLTLGTGVGGGIVINGKLFEGNRGAGAELGHSVIVAGGEPCTCGRRGCLEAYASASALVRDTKRKMKENPKSKMNSCPIESANAKLAFEYKDTDESAAEVVKNYIEKLGVGITNIANVFRPEAIILGGGVCAEGDNLILPLREYMEREVFAGKMGPHVEILTAKLENDAGILGAAALFM